MNKGLIGIMVFIIFTILSCDTKDFAIKPMSGTEMSICHNQTNWTDSLIRDVLSGKWLWIYNENASTSTIGKNTEHLNTYVEFLGDSTLTITINGVLSKTTRWIVVEENSELYGLELESPDFLLNGGILICNGLASFNEFTSEGVNTNFFRKSD